jgi:hypothetical protein
MYSLTIQNATEFREKLTTPKVWRRVYRWEDKWGILRADDWRAEIRHVVASDGEKYLLESVTPYPTSAPPPDVDDVWEEEIHTLPYGTCGNVLVIQGTLLEIQNICTSNKLSLPPVITSYMRQVKEQPNDTRSANRGYRPHNRGRGRGQTTRPTKNVCLIIDV